MPSLAKFKFDGLITKSELLRLHAGGLKRKKDAEAKIVFLHAALATQVAAWDVYVKAVARDYFSATADATNARFMAMHSLLQSRMTEAAKKLNTPNSDNCRNHLIIYTGYDPWPTWVNIRFGKNIINSSLIVRNRIDEIFTLRHSFAHGLSMPAHSWNTNSSGAAHLSCSIIHQTGIFISDLCKKTDAGLSIYISAQHSIARPW